MTSSDSRRPPEQESTNNSVGRDVNGGIVGVGGEQKFGDVTIHQSSHPPASQHVPLLAFLAFLVVVLAVFLVWMSNRSPEPVAGLGVPAATASPAPSDTNVVPTAQDTPAQTVTVKATFDETAAQSTDTLIAGQTEQVALITQTAFAQANGDAQSTLTADSATRTVAAYATETSAVNQTATAWPTSTPVSLEQVVQQASNKVSSNDDWQRIYPVGITHEFNDGVEMVLVPAGCFSMGEKGKGGKQCFDVPFWIDKYEVTNEQFNRLQGKAEKESTGSKAQQPRESITWLEARDFCQITRGIRLPTEREWEYAARGPDELLYPWGNNFVHGNVVYASNSSGQTSAVGRYPAGRSWAGAIDMAGNVWEWTGSWYASYEYTADDGRESSDNTSSNLNFTFRVLRGGSLTSPGLALQTTYRESDNPANDSKLIGFRCARSVE